MTGGRTSPPEGSRLTSVSGFVAASESAPGGYFGRAVRAWFSVPTP